MIKASKKAVLLINLGTPSAATTSAVRNYLTEFLSDPRVVELPACLWKPFLNAILLPFRSKRLTRLYQSIWLAEGSPLTVYSKKLAENFQKQLGDSYQVAFGMSYGKPSIQTALDKLLQNKVQSLTILPLYPQYSAATTASCFDIIAGILKQRRSIPSLHFVSSYFDCSFYIRVIAETIRHYWQENGTSAYLLFSFHDLPKRAVELGDPYAPQCYTKVDLQTKELDLVSEQYCLVFQSRFGKAEWLQPYCGFVLQQLPKEEIKRIAIVCPGFAVDCLETFKEISRCYRELFLKAGGESFHYIPSFEC